MSHSFTINGALELSNMRPLAMLVACVVPLGQL